MGIIATLEKGLVVGCVSVLSSAPVVAWWVVVLCSLIPSSIALPVGAIHHNVSEATL